MNNTEDNLILKQTKAVFSKNWASVIHYIDERLKKETNPKKQDELLDERLIAMKRYKALTDCQLIPCF